MNHSINYLLTTFHWSLILYCFLLLFFVILTTRRLIALINQYIFDGADGRSPYLMTVYILYLFNITLLLYCMMYKSMFAITPFLLMVTFINVLFCLLKMRLINFATVRITIPVKQSLSIITNLLFLGFYVYAVWYINKYILHHSSLANIEYDNAISFLGSLFTSISVHEYFPATIRLLISLFFVIVIFMFDKIEKRSEIKLRGDFALFIGALIFFVIRFDPDSTVPVITVVKAALVLLIHFIYLYITEKEYGSIMAHARQVNVKHGPAIALLTAICKSVKAHHGVISEIEKQKLVFLGGILHKDAELRDMIFSETTLFNATKKKVYTVLRQTEVTLAHNEKHIAIENRRGYDSKAV